jgi:copper(I)-binding protein
MHRLIMAAALTALLASAAAAHDYKLGDLHIDHPVIRVAHPAARTGAGFMTIMNHGKTADRLVAVETAASTRADLHGTFREGNVMRMRAQASGVVIPAGGSVTFAPGGLHVMFIGLKAAVPNGSSIRGSLRFEKAGTIEVAFKAEAAATPSHQH